MYSLYDFIKPFIKEKKLICQIGFYTGWVNNYFLKVCLRQSHNSSYTNTVLFYKK